MVSISPERSPRGASPRPKPTGTAPTDRPLTVTMYDPKSPDAQARVATTYDGKEFKTRKRKTMSKEMRDKVALVRRLGACDVCKARRVACSPDHRRDPTRFSQNKGSSSSGLSSGPPAHRPLQILPAFAQASHMPGYINLDEQSILANVGAGFQNVERVEPEVFNQDPALRDSSHQPVKRRAGNAALGLQAIMTGVEPAASGAGSVGIQGANSATARGQDGETAFTNEAYLGRMRHNMDLESFTKSLEEAVKAAWPSRDSSRYTSVHVLLLAWEQEVNIPSRLPAIANVRELGFVFENVYGFEVETGLIPSDRPSKWIYRKMLDFVERDDSSDSLKIVYYGGDSFISESRENMWCSPHPIESVLSMKSVQNMLEEAESDALLILDACAASSSIGSSTGRGVTELIAARAWNQDSLGPSDTFTQVLVAELSSLAKMKEPFSIAYLYNNLYRKLQNRIDVDNQKSSSTPAPIHLMLASAAIPRSIMISPIKKDQEAEVSNGPLPRVSTNREKSQELDVPQVLISVRLSDTMDTSTLNVDTFKEWLCKFPAGVADVKVEAGFRSF